MFFLNPGAFVLKLIYSRAYYESWKVTELHQICLTFNVITDSFLLANLNYISSNQTAMAGLFAKSLTLISQLSNTPLSAN